MSFDIHPPTRLPDPPCFVFFLGAKRLATSGLDVYAHNIETVRRLQPYVRDKRAGYDQSLSVLKRAKIAGAAEGVYTKTSLMLGLGETEAEIMEVSQPLLLTRTRIEYHAYVFVA